MTDTLSPTMTQSASTETPQPYGWLGEALRRQRDRGAVTLPADLGFIWWTYEDTVDFYSDAMRLTQCGALIHTVHEREDGMIDVVFAVTAADYEVLQGRPADHEEWLEL